MDNNSNIVSKSTSESVIAEALNKWPSDSESDPNAGVADYLGAALRAANMLLEPGAPDAATEGDRESLSDLLFYSEMGRKIPMNQCESAADKTADAVLAAGFSRATVPDAATEQAKQELAACLDLRAYWRGQSVKARTERDAALAAVERVRAIHVRDEYGLCAECSWEYPEASYDALSNDVAWPCPTVAALDWAPEPEWEESK